jgi:alpha-glucosidase
LHATYNFNLLAWAGLSVAGIKSAISDAVNAFNGTGRLTFAFSNHDVPRSGTRQLGPLGLGPESQEALQLLLMKLETSLIGSTCIYQGEELACDDVQDIPVGLMQDPWGIEFAPSFQGRDTCRTPMVWQAAAPNGGFSAANTTWLPIAEAHLKRAALDEAAKPESVYNRFAEFLSWRKRQPAMMGANSMTALSGTDTQIVFDRVSEDQTLRCSFDFQLLTATFEEI